MLKLRAEHKSHASTILGLAVRHFDSGVSMFDVRTEPTEWLVQVSPTGSDSNSGQPGKPVATLGRAQEIVRASGKLGKAPVTIRIEAGTYYLDETLVLQAADSGSLGAPVRWVAEGEVVVSGGLSVKLQWETHQSGIFKATLPDDVMPHVQNDGIDQLIVNGNRQPMARFPNVVAGKNVYGTWDLGSSSAPDLATDALHPTRVTTWRNPAGAYIHAMHEALWGDMHYRVTGRKQDGSLIFEGGWQNNRPSPMHRVFRYVENVFEELDAPGEWFFDRGAKAIYFYPPIGMNIADAKVELVRLRHLVELRGTQENPVRHVSLEGLTFRHAARTFMENREPLLRSDWTTYRGGAVFLTGTEDVTLTGCTFEQLGGNALFVSNYNRRVRVTGGLFRECGGNGVAFVGHPNAVRSPLMNYTQCTDYSAVDRIAGPKADDFPSACVVEDCLITRTGRDEKQTAPVQISMSKSVTVRYCSIYDVPRAGINIGDGTWGGHIVEYCDVFDTVLETGDHGSFNSWGRDRYWDAHGEVVQKEVAEDAGLPFLDAQTPVVLRYNRWRCDHGWDIDLDDGSSNYEIYGNLMLHGGLKLREGYNRIVTNNVIVNNSLHPHCWFEGCGDVFRQNIVMAGYQPARMPPSVWGEEVDYNLFSTSEEDRTRFALLGCDRHSTVGDPQFVDLRACDFRVQETSPARAIGFVSWDFGPEGYGVRSPRLRAIAKTPVVPSNVASAPLPLQATGRSTESVSQLVYDWSGCSIRDLSGEEFSAYGTRQHSPGVLVIRSGQHGQHLSNGDVIVAINGTEIGCMSALVSAIRNLSKSADTRADLSILILRNQQHKTVTIADWPGLPML